MIAIYKNGRVVQSSANLRGIISRSNKIPVSRVDVFKESSGEGGSLGVTWSDDSHTIARFASFAVLQSWVKNRRNFPSDAVKVHA